jgi:hypothetical protein
MDHIAVVEPPSKAATDEMTCRIRKGRTADAVGAGVGAATPEDMKCIAIDAKVRYINL